MMAVSRGIMRVSVFLILFAAIAAPVILPDPASAQATRKELPDTISGGDTKPGLDAVRRLAEDIKAKRVGDLSKGAALTDDEFDRLRDAIRDEVAEQGPGYANGLRFRATPDLQAELGTVVYREYIRTLDHNYDLFRWQLFSTKVSFAMTILLVLSGIVFSAMQFWKSFRAAGAGEPVPTELELSGGRIKVSSPVLGVVILVISLGFFYLFMLHAYPIEDVRKSVEAERAVE